MQFNLILLGVVAGLALLIAWGFWKGG